MGLAVDATDEVLDKRHYILDHQGTSHFKNFSHVGHFETVGPRAEGPALVVGIAMEHYINTIQIISELSEIIGWNAEPFGKDVDLSISRSVDLSGAAHGAVSLIGPNGTYTPSGQSKHREMRQATCI